MKKNLNTRIEEELLEQFTEAINKTGVSRTFIIKEAIKDFVKKTNKKKI